MLCGKMGLYDAIFCGRTEYLLGGIGVLMLNKNWVFGCSQLFINFSECFG